MCSARTPASPDDGEICIDACQLRPGVHVRLPMAWVDNPFMFNSFVIANEEQIRVIAALKLPQLFCSLARCKVPPLPAEESTDPERTASQVEHDQTAACAPSKGAAPTRDRECAAVVDRLKGKLDRAQQHYLAAENAVDNAIKTFTAKPAEAFEQIRKVSEISVAAMLTDPDSAIILITEKAQSDGHAAHSLSVMTLALLIGKQANLPELAMRAIGTAALLHDIGKQGMDASILRRSERNRHEEASYQTHCRRGFDAATRAGTLTQAMLDAILHHHERFDGSGFPDRLSGKNIPLAARIVAIANRFDNLVNPIDYRRALSPSNALSTLWAREHMAFDRVLLQLFVRAMGVYPPGSLVQLSDGRVGVVIASAAAGKPLCPTLMIYAPEVSRQEATIIVLADVEGLSIERSLHPKDRPPEELDYLLPRRKLKWSQLLQRA